MWPFLHISLSISVFQLLHSSKRTAQRTAESKETLTWFENKCPEEQQLLATSSCQHRHFAALDRFFAENTVAWSVSTMNPVNVLDQEQNQVEDGKHENQLLIYMSLLILIIYWHYLMLPVLFGSLSIQKLNYCVQLSNVIFSFFSSNYCVS